MKSPDDPKMTLGLVCFARYEDIPKENVDTGVFDASSLSFCCAVLTEFTTKEDRNIARE